MHSLSFCITTGQSQISDPTTTTFTTSHTPTGVTYILFTKKKTLCYRITDVKHNGLSENYRPASLTSVIFKSLERLIKGHMMDFLVRHRLLNPPQHGFLKARSCFTNILRCLDEITKWIDEGSLVDIIYFRFLGNATSKTK